jgi:threonylcarbamoyladenosine tRNA methylthiotransferase MtaB
LPTIQNDELDTLCGKNIRFVRHRASLAHTLSQIAAECTATSHKNKTKTSYNANIKPQNHLEIKDKMANPPKLGQLLSFKDHTRAFIKVQDGCDGFCSYCIIPKARPCIETKPVEAVLAEAQQLVNAGHKEIVLTGIFLGAYGQKTVRRKNWPNQENIKLAELLEKLSRMPERPRIRLSSLEPSDVTEQLLNVFCEHRNIMPHLHLSLQSGSDKILKRMCRQYTSDEFMEKVELVKTRLDQPAITTDIIVGFPGETQADYEKTVDIARKTGFSRMHVFGFSARKGTAAAGFKERIDAKTIKERSLFMRELGKELGFQFRQTLVGKEDTVLTENKNGECCGRSRRYFMVEIKGKKCEKNELVRVKLVKNRQDGMIGQAI